MPAKPLPDQSVLHQILRYEPDTGKLYWRERPLELFTISDTSSGRGNRGLKTAEQAAAGWNNAYANTEAFTAANDRGYLRGLIFGQSYKAHRVIYKMVHGEEPDEIDHINMDRSDNRLCNLRSVTHRENCSHFLGPNKRKTA